MPAIGADIIAHRGHGPLLQDCEHWDMAPVREVSDLNRFINKPMHATLGFDRQPVFQQLQFGCFL